MSGSFLVILLEKVPPSPSSVFTLILPSLVRRVDELLDSLFLYIAILHEVVLVHVAQAPILAFFWTSLNIESEADHSEVASMNSLVQLSSLAEAGLILPLRLFGSCAPQEEFSFEILLQKPQTKLLVLLDVLDLPDFSRIFAPLDFLQIFFLRFFHLHCSNVLSCENNVTGFSVLLCENHAIGFPMLDRNDDELCPEFFF